MIKTQITILLSCLLYMFQCQPVLARTVQPVHGKPMPDLEVEFQAKCNGATKDPQCPFWAAALKLELKELIVTMQNFDSKISEDIHREMLAVTDGNLQKVALNFTRNYRSADSSFWKKAQEFLFGEDMALASTAADYLSESSEKDATDLADSFRKARSSGLYSFSSVTLDETVEGQVWDTSIAFKSQDIANFPSPLSRLSFGDRFNVDPLSSGPGLVWIVGFSSSLPMSNLEAQISQYSGLKMYLPYDQLVVKEAALQQEIQELAARLQAGDYSVMARYQAAMQEYQEVTGQVVWYELLDAKTGSVKLWVSPVPNQAYELNFAYALSYDSVLDKAVVRYITN